MGKVRVKTFGTPEEEELNKHKAKAKKEAKKFAKAPGAKGGERVVAIGPSEEEIIAEVSGEKTEKQTPTEGDTKSDKTAKSKKDKFIKRKGRSQRYKSNLLSIDKSKTYSLNEALELLSKFQKSKFDETIELHLNTVKGGISGTLTLPHGSGKITKVAIADDKTIEEIEKGLINFDILVATPDMMPKLARVAKVLGPRGLMPNPKNGTITAKPDEIVKKFEAGQMSFKTEQKAPLIHMVVGKFSFGDKKLSDNISAAVEAIKVENISKITLKSTMSPGIKVQI